MPQAQVSHPLCVTSQAGGHSLHYIVLVGHMPSRCEATVTREKEIHCWFKTNGKDYTLLTVERDPVCVCVHVPVYV